MEENVAVRMRMDNRNLALAKINSEKLISWCFLTWLVCLGIQIPLPFIELRFAVSDIFLLPFLFLFFLGKRLIWRSFLFFDFLCLLSLFPVALMQHVLVVGRVTSYALINKGIGILVLFVSFLFVVNAIRDFKSFLRALQVFTIATGILNLLYSSSYLPFWPNQLKAVFIYGESRLRGLLVDPNAYSGLLVVAFFLYLPFMRTDKGKPLLNWIVFFSLLLGVFLSLSRSGYLAFAAGCIAVLLLSRSLARYVLAVFACVIFLMGILVLFPLGSVFLARILSTSQITSRIEIIEAAIRAFREHPIMGLGLGSFFELSQDYYGLPWRQIIHNTYIWFLADFGIVGFLFILLFFLHILAEGWQVALFLHQRRSPAFYYVVVILSSLFAMMVFAIGIEAFYQRHFWMLIGMLEALRRLKGNRIVVFEGENHPGSTRR